MMSVWHLVWLMPLAGSAGFMLAALMAAAAREDERMMTECKGGDPGCLKKEN